MENFNETIAAINSIPAVPAILDVVCRTTGMGFAAVARVTEDRWIAGSVLDKIAFGLKPGDELKIETTICHEIRESREAVIIDHVEEDARYCGHHTPLMYGFQSYISMPIFLSDGRFFGTLCSIDPRPARLNTPEIVGMFKLFTELIAFHIDASDKLARSESRLLKEREASELREQFIGVLGHDLRTPLGAISIGTALLESGRLDDNQDMALQMMKRSVGRMSDLINDAMDFARGRLGGGIELESRPDALIEAALRQVVSEIRAVWPARTIIESFSILEGVHCDPRRIAQLFNNLLSNAMTHGKSDQPVTIRVLSASGTFELSVANASDPISPDIMTRLFEPFSRGGAKDYQEGLGLGLYIASQIAKSHGGTLRVSSDVGETRFTFTMPCQQSIGG